MLVDETAVDGIGEATIESIGGGSERSRIRALREIGDPRRARVTRITIDVDPDIGGFEIRSECRWDKSIDRGDHAFFKRIRRNRGQK